MNIASLLKQLNQKLQMVTNIPQLEAELLLAQVTQLSRAQLHAYSDRNLTTEELAALNNLLERRLNQEPIAYILGYKEFWSKSLHVTKDTLIPRPETENLVEWILNHFSKSQNLTVADLGTGSGAIAIALASEHPQWQITATDYNPNTLAVAQENAMQFQLNNIQFRLGDWFQALIHNDYDLIVSNPPYIAENDPYLPNLAHEPKAALVAKDSGLADLTILIRDAKNYLKPNGVLVLEHGYEQGAEVRQLLQKKNYKNIQTHRDLSGLERFTSAQNRNR